MALALISISLATAANARAEFFNNGLFGRSRGQIFNTGVGGLFRNGVLDLSLGLPAAVASFSRLSVPTNQIKGANANLNDRRIDGRGLGTDFVNRNIFLNTNGLLLAAFADAQGNQRSGFSAFTPIDTELRRQAEKFFIDNTKLGKPNDPFAELEARAQGNAQALRNLFVDRIAANNLAARSIPPAMRQFGVAQIQCAKPGPNGEPRDVLAAKINDNDKPPAEYLRMDWIDRCIAMVSASLNSVVDPRHPPIFFDRSMVNPLTGEMRIPNIFRHFTIRQLGTLFGKQDNTKQFCNSDNPNSFPIPTAEYIATQTSLPKIINSMLWDGDLNRNLVAYSGVNMVLPDEARARQGRTDVFLLDNKTSSVATGGKGTERKVEAYRRGNARLTITLDSNSDKQGVSAQSQNGQQTGRVNGFAQSEGFLMMMGRAPNGVVYERRYDFLAAAPERVEVNGVPTVIMKTAEEAPASAAHAGKAVVAGQCIQCHTNGSELANRKGTSRIGVPGTSGQNGLSATFSEDQVGFKNFLALTRQLVMSDNKKQNGVTQEFRPVKWDAYKRAALEEQSPAYVAASTGFTESQIRSIMNRPDVKQGENPNGTFNPEWLRSGGTCLIKRLVGAPQNQLAQQNQQPPRAASIVGARDAAFTRPGADGEQHL